MNFFNNPYTCALSGIPAPIDEVEDAEGLPEGWIEISVKRRFYNPKWEAIQNVKQGLMQQTLAAIPEDQREDQLVNVAIQVEAQFLALEDKTDEYIVEHDGPIYISPPEDDPQLMAAWNAIRKSLGLGPELEDVEEAAEENVEEAVEEKIESLPPTPPIAQEEITTAAPS